jgi:DNA (cytosine-5)-methyltransferase 1
MCSRLQEFGYGLGYRILDAQYFGVAARRRRIFLVGILGGQSRAAKVLFDTPSKQVLASQSKGTQKEDSSGIKSGFGTVQQTRYGNNQKIAGTLISSPGGGIERLGSVVIDGDRPRWLTPLERERLMGFPDGYTAGFSDTQRHRMVGNSMAVPVIRWIGQRILSVEQESMPLSRAG